MWQDATIAAVATWMGDFRWKVGMHVTIEWHDLVDAPNAREVRTRDPAV